MDEYLPEGYQFQSSPFTYEALKDAMHSRQILEAVVCLCDESHDLYVDLGCCRGKIPREEAAIGIDTGQTRDIAILLLVGRPICFCVTEISADGEVTLSRTAAQKIALQSLLSKKPGDVLPAIITNLTAFGAFCDVGCGITALLPLSAISVSRIRHPSERFRCGQTIYSIIQSIDHMNGRITLSHKELLGTWQENVSCFSQGQTVPGIVRSKQDYGVFIELAPNLSGLAEPDDTLTEGETVSVFIKSILPDKCKIKLVVLRKLGIMPMHHLPLHYTQTEGRINSWQYAGNSSMLTIF